MTLLIKALKLFGLAWSKDKKTNGFVQENNEKSILSTILKYLMIFSLHLYFVHMITSPLLYANRKKDFTRIFYEVSLWMKYIFTLLAYDIFFFRKNNLGELWTSIKNINAFKISLKKENVMVIMVIIYFIFHEGRDMFNITQLSDKFYSTFVLDRFYGMEEVSTNRSLVTFVYVADIIVKGLVFALLRPFLYLFVINCVNRFCAKLDNFRERLPLNFNNDEKLSEVLIEHTEILKLNDSLGEQLGFFYVIWVGEWMVSFFVDAPRIVELYAEGHNGFLIFQILTTLVIDIVFALFVSFTISDISSNHDVLLCEAQITIAKQTMIKTPQIKSAFLIEKFDSGKIGFMAFKCILITKSFILNLYFFSSTFVIFAVQQILTQNNGEFNATILTTNDSFTSTMATNASA